MTSSANTISNLVSICQTIAKVGSSFSSAKNLYDVLTGHDGTSRIVAALKHLELTMAAGFNSVVAAINDGILQQEWSVYAKHISGVQRKLARVGNELATLTQDAGGRYWILSTQKVPFDIWAGGGEYLGIKYESAIEACHEQARCLNDLFESGGVANLSMLDVWRKLCQIGANNIVQDMKGQTLLSAFYMLQQQIYGILCAIFYYNESILALYDKINGNEKQFTSLKDYVRTTFGETSAIGTAWNKFAQHMDRWPDLPADFFIIATTGDYHPNTPNSCAPVNQGEGVYVSRFWSQWTRTSQYPKYKNLVLTELRIEVEVKESNRPVFFLSAAMAEVLPGLAFEVRNARASSWIDGTHSPHTDDYITVGTHTKISWVNSGYGLRPKMDTSPDRHPVVTGFRCVNVYGNRLALQLEFGILDVTNPNAPVVTVVGEGIVPAGEGQAFSMSNAQWVDLRPSTGSSGFPIDNVSFAVTYGNRIGLSARTGWPIFKASFMQPTKTLVPYAYDPRK